MPILRLFPGLPRRVFFSWAAAFFGGMFPFFLACAGGESEKRLATRCMSGEEDGGWRERAGGTEEKSSMSSGLCRNKYAFSNSRFCYPRSESLAYQHFKLLGERRRLAAKTLLDKDYRHMTG